MWSLVFIVVIFALFWLLFIRPASRRQKDLRNLQSSLAPGDEVMLTSGFFGTVEGVDDDKVRVTVADGVVVTVARAAIARTLTEPSADDAESDETGPADHGDGPDDQPIANPTHQER